MSAVNGMFLRTLLKAEIAFMYNSYSGLNVM